MNSYLSKKKTILVPTDFSDNAYKALEYASYLALKIDASVLLLNSYQIPQTTSNVMINFSDILEKDSKENLEKLKVNISSNTNFSEVGYETISCFGYLSGAIESTAKNHSFDLIVMGTTGASNLKNKIFGSNTVEIIKKANFPIVVVPGEVEFSEWKNVILASNQDDTVQKVATVLSDFINLDETNINIVSVASKDYNGALDHTSLIESLKGWHLKFHTEKNDSVVDGIVKYTERHESDIIVLLRKSYTFIEKILHISVTKKLALLSKKPLFLLRI